MCKIAILDKRVGEAQHCDVVKDDPFFFNTCDVSSYLYKTNLICYVMFSIALNLDELDFDSSSSIIHMAEIFCIGVIQTNPLELTYWSLVCVQLIYGRSVIRGKALVRSKTSFLIENTKVNMPTNWLMSSNFIQLSVARPTTTRTSGLTIIIHQLM